ncbi:hypothetical protein [Noviherbaspirillum galbum]|uniref:Uncharacterized protein n=1 Tax=Noviherbaspirillum galbum TaxID=2709383 RepID=A0A6B3SSK7_9BURK|nr:hypothetical protein [Noviherbaspirillum galbum]NEX63448.1 hypothetical protein [Noviherbaspirillum galbum]
MSSQHNGSLSAEERFRQAFERLKADAPKVLTPGTPVTQNNVAREAGCDPSALKKARFPALIREIQAYSEIHQANVESAAQKTKKRRTANRSIQQRMEDAIKQRDEMASKLISAGRRILELAEENRSLQQRLNEVQPPPARIF